MQAATLAKANSRTSTPVGAALVADRGDGWYTATMDMDGMESIDLTAFSGRLPLFPLPNVVHFPNVVLPLHVFEPRYKAMVADAIEGDRLVGMVLLRPGYEADYDGCPPIHEVACLGKIVEDKRLADGRFNIMLLGAARARILREVSQSPYRVAEVELIDEVPFEDEEEETAKRLQLRDAACRFFSRSPGVQEKVKGLFDLRLPLGATADLLAAAAPIDLEEKQILLESVVASARVTRLAALLAVPDLGPTRWKPSEN